MGWGSAGHRIFDPVARALIAAGTPADQREDILADLIATLQEEDWDTELDSLDHFLTDPPTVRAFARHGITNPAAADTTRLQALAAVVVDTDQGESPFGWSEKDNPR
ncbi:hypothetical protein [Streptomyces sp. H27-H5]|uniref:hypothetical protein n=1 Tax=Streptomyces sp. H27-H5 TaxID=2996460 RepID=UPI0022719E08|nr:hypothetical protein [Streptomyces sp. H27-H5]MCY0957679.1 hypothetical protein [Streptomyces sp. H27-H5]